MKRLGYWLCLALASAALAMAAVADDDKNEPKPKWTGSIRVEGKHTQAELQQMAKITAQEAVRVALAAVPGDASKKKVTETELEVENDFLVYGVEIRVDGQKGERDVTVDAGNGKVLAQEIEDEDDDD